jgi:hypothetical protein
MIFLTIHLRRGQRPNDATFSVNEIIYYETQNCMIAFCAFLHSAKSVCVANSPTTNRLKTSQK